MIVMALFFVPLGSEPMNFLDAALEIGLDLFLTIALFGEGLFFTTKIVALLFEAGAKSSQHGLLALEVSRPLADLDSGPGLLRLLGSETGRILLDLVFQFFPLPGLRLHFVTGL